MSVLDLRRQFEKRAEEAEAIRWQGARDVEIDKVIMLMLGRLERKDFSAAEISDRFRCWADSIAEVEIEDSA